MARLPTMKDDSSMTSTKISSRPFLRLFLAGIALSLLLQAVVPLALALAAAPWRGLLCTASLHGHRAVPCSLGQLVSESFANVLFSNLLLGGLPTFLTFGGVVMLCVLGFALRALVHCVSSALRRATTGPR